MGVSQDTFNRYNEFVEWCGIDALIEKNRRAQNIKNRVDEETKKTLMVYAVE